MEVTFRVDLGLVSGLYLVLVLFGIGYNSLTSWMEKHGYMEGYTSLMVALGVLITLAPFAVVCWQAVLLVLGGFIASGLPMIIGSISRYLLKREIAQKELAKVANEFIDLQGE
jgi:hypothetical protein